MLVLSQSQLRPLIDSRQEEAFLTRALRRAAGVAVCVALLPVSPGSTVVYRATGRAGVLFWRP